MIQVPDLAIKRSQNAALHQPNETTDWNLASAVRHCGSSPGWPQRPTTSNQVGFTVLEESPARTVRERVLRYATVVDAQRQLADARAVVLACKPPDPDASMAIKRENFAGQQSMLVRTIFAPGDDTMHVLVRQGDLIAEVWTEPAPSEPEAVRLAQRAADRLCQGTTAC